MARNSWESAIGFSLRNPWPEWDHDPTGQVAFEMDVYLRYSSQIRRSFKDAKIQRLENMAADIAVGMAVLGAAKREDDRKAEEARVREEEATGRIHYTRWTDKTGQTRYGCEIIAEQVDFLSRPRGPTEPAGEQTLADRGAPPPRKATRRRSK